MNLSTTPPARLLIDPPQSGPLNMAVDQVLLESAVASGDVILRFYQWSEPTLSLGYFQPVTARDEHMASREASIVRRASGGGAILHDRELTYSLIVPAGRLGIAENEHGAATDLYDAVHASLIAALAELGISARLCGSEAQPLAPAAQPFLCFARRTAGDVLVGDCKIGGSAQRRYRGAVLQHGSILLEVSRVAPELPGIEQLAAVHVEPERLIEVWLPLVAGALGVAFQPDRLGVAEEARARELVEQRYGASQWTELR